MEPQALEPQWSRQGQELVEPQSWPVGLGETEELPAETVEPALSRLERRRARVVSWWQRQRQLQKSTQRDGFAFPLEVRQLFLKLVNGATRADWSCLANFHTMTDAARAYNFPSYPFHLVLAVCCRGLCLGFSTDTIRNTYGVPGRFLILLTSLLL